MPFQPMQAVVIGVDPGLHTGICVLGVSKDAKSTIPQIKGYSVQLLSLFTTHDDETAIDAFDRVIGIYTALEVPLIVTCEHFVFTRVSTMGGSRNAVEMTGALKSSIRRCGGSRKNIQLFTDQKPADAKMITLQHLKDLGLIVRGDRSDDHAQMAARHAVQAVQRIRKGKILL